MESATPPKRISLTDPAARYTAAPGGPAFFAYSTNYLIDLHAGIIVDVEATPAYRTQEVESTKTMVDRVEQRFNLKPKRLVGDTAYGTGAMLGWMVEEKGIEPHVPVWQRPPRNDGTFPNSDFNWIEQSDEYRCPAGHALRKERRQFKEPRSHITKAGTIIYRSSQTDCAACSMKDQCCPNTPMRKISHSVYEEARDEARAIANTPAYKRSRRERKKVEMLFAHLKRILKLDRLRLRGPSGAHDEFLLAATAQNLRRMAKRLCRRVNKQQQQRCEAHGGTAPHANTVSDTATKMTRYQKTAAATGCKTSFSTESAGHCPFLSLSEETMAQPRWLRGCPSESLRCAALDPHSCY
jgi:uncharacterized protein (UPF0179 family)